jgi:26S proteasome regulatory subunit N3
MAVDDEMEGIVKDVDELQIAQTTVSGTMGDRRQTIQDRLTMPDIRSNFGLLERAVAQFDARFTLRALRAISGLRKRLDPQILTQVVAHTYPARSETTQVFLKAIGISSERARPIFIDAEKSGSAPKKEVIPEIDIYLAVLIQVYLWDSKNYKLGAEFSNVLVDRIRMLNRRTLDSLSAKAYFYLSLFFEKLDPQPPSPQAKVVEIRGKLLAALKSAVLRKDEETQAAVIVLLLRNYISTRDIAQADALVAQTDFPQTAPNNQVARYMYYLGRIRAIQLAYTDAHEHLTSATRKAPTSQVAVGFYQDSMKLLVVVELLMGDIPDRSVFSQPRLENALEPYFKLVRAVREGEMQGFLRIVNENAEVFHRDGTYTLILRLRQNVIRTGIRRLSLSYSRIPLRDICIRLGLDSEESAEYIVAKAIRDGVIEATIDHEKGYMQTKQAGDVYATREPAEAFNERIRACLSLHDECVKAMRFPMNQHRLELKNAQEARERERELAKEIQDGDIDEDDAGGDFEGL